MYEFHAWLSLSDSADETDADRVEAVAGRLLATIAAQSYPSAQFSVERLNGSVVLLANGLLNRRDRAESHLLEELLAVVGEELPGSYGLLYERDDEATGPPGGNAFGVRVMTRGRFAVRDDPFLSPADPVIEGPWSDA